MKKLIILLPIICIFSLSCGYKMVTYSKDRPIKFYIERLVNETINTEYEDIIESYIDNYFIKFGEAASYNNAVYFLHPTLTKAEYGAPTENENNETVSYNMGITLIIVVTDSNGNEIFSSSYSSASVTNLSGFIADSLSSRRSSIISSLETILDNFRNEFINKIVR